MSCLDLLKSSVKSPDGLTILLGRISFSVRMCMLLPKVNFSSPMGLMGNGILFFMTYLVAASRCCPEDRTAHLALLYMLLFPSISSAAYCSGRKRLLPIPPGNGLRVESKSIQYPPMPPMEESSF